jgi:cytosine/adenosine deaminase-related metal-dependent hydrolase
MTWTLTARWILPVAGPPLERGLVILNGERILDVKPYGTRAADVDLGNAAVLPGLVNAHTHLDLSGLRGQCPPTPDFTGWLRQVIRHRRALSTADVANSVAAGLAESLRCGTTLLGDISALGLSWPVLKDAPLRSVVFYELIGLPKQRAEAAWEVAEAWLKEHPATPICRPGLSPHAPYSVSDWLFYRAATAADGLRLPLATHLAETVAECELLAEHRGPFVDFLVELGVWSPDDLVGSPEQVGLMYDGYVRAPKAPVLYVHGNYLDPGLLHTVSRGVVVYCPRTHAAFGHPPHPFRYFLGRGLRVALGTDSLASNPDLDVLAEARFLHRRYPELPGAQLLRMATLSGAEALGWQAETGSLEPGKSADLIVVPLPDEDAADPHRLVFASALPVSAVLWRGRWTAGR